LQEDIWIGGSDSADLTRHAFYGGDVILEFDRPSWSYTRLMPDGLRRKFAGVTGTCHIIDKSEVLIRWAVKVAMAKAKRLLIEGRFVGEEATSILFESTLDDIIKEAKKADKEELDAAAEIGHIAHDWIECYVRAILSDNDERRLELLAKLPEDERAANACVAAIDWMVAHDVRWIATERRCCSRQHEYAGTMDGLALVSSCHDKLCCPHEFKDRLTLVDWKTSNYLYIEYLLQTAAYQHAHEEETGEKIEDRWVIRLGKEDAEFDPWHVEGRELYETDFRGFVRALALSRSVEEISQRIDEGTEAKKAAKHAALVAAKAAANLIACPVSGEYKGIRKKKGCNGTDVLCQKCEAIWKSNN